MGNYEQYKADLERELSQFECNFKPIDDLLLTLDENLHKLLVEEHYQKATVKWILFPSLVGLLILLSR